VGGGGGGGGGGGRGILAVGGDLTYLVSIGKIKGYILDVVMQGFYLWIYYDFFAHDIQLSRILWLWGIKGYGAKYFYNNDKRGMIAKLCNKYVNQKHCFTYFDKF
jgi:hypothetical protein